MEIFTLNSNNMLNVAEFMAALKPDWWSAQGAFAQLSGGVPTNVGWFLGEDENTPRGWLLCTEFPSYSYLNIECLGFDDAGHFTAGNQLKPLLEKAEKYARDADFRLLRYVISSQGMFCDNKPIDKYWEVLRDLEPSTRTDFNFMVEYGFKPAGFLPNCYAKGLHGIILIKELI